MDAIGEWNFWWTLAASTVAAIDFITLVFLAAWRLRRIDLIDSFWGPTFIVAILAAVWVSGPLTISGWLIVSLIAVWSVRLWWHIFRRFLKSDRQDARYTELSRKWPTRYKWAQVYLRVYLVQALLAVVISLPVITLVHAGGVASNWWLAVGVAVWLIGFLCESLADKQLALFVGDKTNKGKLMTKGLWQYSRHPNYLGEITQWWGIWLAIIGIPYATFALIGPLTITYLIRFVSGVPPAEKRMSAKPGWQEYKDRTSMLLPLPGNKH
jgi:steroid 5-alpha reductase family enzyme